MSATIEHRAAVISKRERHLSMAKAQGRADLVVVFDPAAKTDVEDYVKRLVAKTLAYAERALSTADAARIASDELTNMLTRRK